MPKGDPLIRTKLRRPFTRQELVPRPRLQARIAEGLCGPLTLITAPAGFGKTTLVASHLGGRGMPVAWLSLDKADNQAERFLKYLVASIQEADASIGSEAARLAAARQVFSEAVLTSLVNELDAAGGEMALVLDDYQFIRSPAIHEAVSFLIEHCPSTLHLLVATRSDPPLPLPRLRARGQVVELRASDLRFTESEAAQFLNEVMGLGLDGESVAALEERTEGWIAGLQMAALSMRGREDVGGFIEAFSGTNRYIMDYLLEEVLASQTPGTQRFLLTTSVLERLTAPLCDALFANEGGAETRGHDPGARSESFSGGQSTSILEYLERANLFLVPLDDERIWYRYHHLFADLLRAQLHRSLDAEDVARLHVRAAEWHARNGSVLEAIHHASMASDDERVERFIEQHYMELVRRGEQSWLRSWTDRLNKERVYSRPWLCIYEAYSHSWFGELDEADRLLEEAEKRIRSEMSASEARAMEGLLLYVKSRVTAMRGDLDRAIELCLAARESIPASNLALQLDTRITLGYEYFLSGDYANAEPTLRETIELGTVTGAVINTVAASCLLARLYGVQGLLRESYDTYQRAAQRILEAGGQHLGARALVEIGLADVRCEWNDLEAALTHIEQGLAMLPMWDKADDWVLAYLTLARIHLARANVQGAMEAAEKAIRLIQTRGVFSEARHAGEVAQVRLWLAQGDLRAASRWAESQEERSGSGDRCRFEDELAHMARARVLIALARSHEALDLLSRLEETAWSAGRMGRVIEILLLKTLALQERGDSESALLALTECLTLTEPEGYARIFLDEGQPIQLLFARWLAHAGARPSRDHGPVREYATFLLSQFDAETRVATAAPEEEVSPSGGLVEPLTPRELEVLHLIALGKTNRQIAEQLIVAPGTVKAHTSSIYGKLNVANRTEAVARARQLSILP